MKNKIKILLCTVIMSVISFSAFLLTATNNVSMTTSYNEPYRVVFNSERNKLHNYTGSQAYSGESVVKTNLSNNINMTYVDLMGLSSTWHVLKNGGSFYNTSPIHGLSSIKLCFKTDSKDFKIYWSGSTSFTEERSAIFSSSSDSQLNFNFNYEMPTYFKLVNVSGSNINISEMILDFSCQNNYPYLSLNVNDPTMGSVTGSGLKSCGEEVSIIATPKPGYRFVGWYLNDELISSDETYDFVMWYEDITYFAYFTYQTYNFIVQSESNTKGSVNDVSGTYDYLTSISIEATANKGFTFDGWYSNNHLVSTANPYIFNMPYQNTTYTAKFSTNSYSLILVNTNPDLGTISSSNSYLYGSSVTIVATPNAGVSFLGWYDINDNLISPLLSYTFNMPHDDIVYSAKFEWTPFDVEITVNDSIMGSVNGAGCYIYQQEVVLVANPNDHYSFFGWFNGDNLLSRELIYKFNMPAKSLNYDAVFVKNHNLYVYSDDETKGTVTYPFEWGEGLEVTITANAKDGYALDYWYDEDLNEVSYDATYTFEMPKEDLVLYAAFDVGYKLFVSSSDTSKGVVSSGGSYKVGRTVNVVVKQIAGVFKGWLDDQDNLVSTQYSYSFVMPSRDYSLLAYFLTDEEEEQERNEKNGIIPTIDLKNQIITYGLYPQTHVNDSTIVSRLNALTQPEENGFYLLDGYYYAKRDAYISYSNQKFSDNTTIVNGKTYWFKAEAIKWNIVEGNNGEFTLISRDIIDNSYYSSWWGNNKQSMTDYQGSTETVYSNNYQYSSLRTWLNTDFYNTAFSLNFDYIHLSLVDNSLASTCQSQTKYICSNTSDMVYVPCSRDVNNARHGVGAKTMTDFAKCMSSYSGNYSNKYWTRSPASYYENPWWVQTIYWNGAVGDDGDKVGMTSSADGLHGVSPMISFSYNF